MSVWPITLPQKFEQEGFTDSEPDLFVKTEMDAGPPKLRRRFTVSHHPISGTMIMTAYQKAVFRTFYRAYGSQKIVFPDPDSDGTINIIFTGIPEYISYSSTYWQVKLSMAVMPGPEVGTDVNISSSISPSMSPPNSYSPSLSKSLSPSISRSISPSRSPSISPSLSPPNSISPSLSPSISRSISPSASPSASISPSVSPPP